MFFSLSRVLACLTLGTLRYPPRLLETLLEWRRRLPTAALAFSGWPVVASSYMYPDHTVNYLVYGNELFAPHPVSVVRWVKRCASRLPQGATFEPSYEQTWPLSPTCATCPHHLLPPSARVLVCARAAALRHARFLPGSGNCGYLVSTTMFTAALWEGLASAPPGAFYMDDVWISGQLAANGVPRLVVRGGGRGGNAGSTQHSALSQE